MFETVVCPELVAPDDRRCNAIAEVRRRDVMQSTDGPIEFISSFCLNGHVIMLCPAEKYEVPAAPAAAAEEADDATHL